MAKGVKGLGIVSAMAPIPTLARAFWSAMSLAKTKQNAHTNKEISIVKVQDLTWQRVKQKPQNRLLRNPLE